MVLTTVTRTRNGNRRRCNIRLIPRPTVALTSPRFLPASSCTAALPNTIASQHHAHRRKASSRIGLIAFVALPFRSCRMPKDVLKVSVSSSHLCVPLRVCNRLVWSPNFEWFSRAVLARDCRLIFLVLGWRCAVLEHGDAGGFGRTWSSFCQKLLVPD